jgi:TetR/AcrR family transcriptional repressor of nem operon
MTTATRQRILEAGAQLIHRQGFNHTGIQEILQAAGVPKGSFYFYFKSKKDFGLALIDYFGQFWLAKVEEILEDKSLPPLARLRAFFQWFQDYFSQNGFSGGCPVGNLAQEMGDVSPAFGLKLSQAIDFMAGRLARVLEEARQAGELDPACDPVSLAYFIVASWQGALIRMKALKCSQPLETFQQVVFERLLAK